MKSHKNNFLENIARLKFDLGPLPRQLVDLLPSRCWSGILPIVDQDIAGGQFAIENEHALTRAGLSPHLVQHTAQGYANNPTELGYATDRNKLKGMYTIGKQKRTKKKPFGVATGNPPYSKYHESMKDTLDTYECGYQIIPAAFMTGSTTRDAQLRKQLIDAGVYHFEILNMGTFAEVQKITVAVFWDHYNQHKNITLTRGGITTTVTCPSNVQWELPYGDAGLLLLEKAQPFIGQRTMIQGRGKRPNVDWCVALGEKVAFNQVGWNDKYDRPIVGVVRVLARNDAPTDAMKRFIICQSRVQAEFLASYLRSVEFSIMGSQIAAEKNFTLDLFNRLPIFVRNEPFTPEVIWKIMNAEKEFKTIYNALKITR